LLATAWWNPLAQFGFNELISISNAPLLANTIDRLQKKLVHYLFRCVQADQNLIAFQIAPNEKALQPI
jgi:hypothetical protein